MEEQERVVNQEILSWGAGSEGQLGTGRLDDEHQPHLITPTPPLSLPHISLLSCGGAHVIALTPPGQVFSWGRGTSGQLGHGDRTTSPLPTLLRSLQARLIIHVSAGWNHSGFVQDTGALFTCGDASFGQLGHAHFESQSLPTRVHYFDGARVLQIACGMRHSLALLQGHEVFAFGAGKRGQLGISTSKVKSVSVPHKTLGLEDVKIMSIIANGDHSAALSSHTCIPGEEGSMVLLISILRPASIHHCQLARRL